MDGIVDQGTGISVQPGLMEINRTGRRTGSNAISSQKQEAVTMKLKNGTWVLVCDGSKFLLLENNGVEDIIDLRVVAHDQAVNPATRDQGTDRPGRFAISSDRRGTTQETDWHQLAETRFAQDLAEKLGRWETDKRFSDLVIVSDSRTLGVLRSALSDQVKKRVRGEVQKDYAHRAIAFIETALAKE
ncbi:host attachment protein [Hyphomonas sp.]|uniref:baeRF12 domain-containing protein n=1 Tax=Hyphomonas sp. TaxID=87 RepID=UPI003565980F